MKQNRTAREKRSGHMRKAGRRVRQRRDSRARGSGWLWPERSQRVQGQGQSPPAQHGPGPVQEGACVLHAMLKSAGMTPKVKGLKHERDTSRKGMQVLQSILALSRRRLSGS